MKTTMKATMKGFVMAASAVALLGCVDASDYLGGMNSASPSGEMGPGATTATQSSAALVTRTRLNSGLTGRVRLPFDPTRIPFNCEPGGVATALVQTSAGPIVDVPYATGFRYRIENTPTLRVAAYVQNLCGAHYARFDFYDPNGQLYTRRPATFVAQGDGTGARRVGDGYVIEAVLPIAGTDIAGLPMTGAWSVNFVVDGAPAALGLGLFELYN